MYAYGLLCKIPAARNSWLRKAAFEGHQGAIHVLASECHNPQERQRWLRLAAGFEGAAEMEESVRICETLDDRDRWLAEADRNGWQSAMAELCDSAC
jgi:hypothetical protein